MHLSSQPIIILGNPRSGTTLLRLILASHSQIVIPPEAGFMCWLSQYYASAAPSSWKNKLFLEEFSLEVCKSKKFITWGLSEK